MVGGEGRIRTCEEKMTLPRVRDGCLKPLGHLSVEEEVGFEPTRLVARPGSSRLR